MAGGYVTTVERPARGRERSSEVGTRLLEQPGAVGRGGQAAGGQSPTSLRKNIRYCRSATRIASVSPPWSDRRACSSRSDL